MTRMNREQFFGMLATLDEQRLKKALWNVYWRGSAAMRERIEAEIAADGHDRREPRSRSTVDPELVRGVGDRDVDDALDAGSCRGLEQGAAV